RILSAIREGEREVRLNCGQQVAGASIVQEEQPLPYTPQRSRAELVRSRVALYDVIGQARAHIVHQQVRIKIDLLATQRLDVGTDLLSLRRGIVDTARRERRRVAQSAPD